MIKQKTFISHYLSELDKQVNDFFASKPYLSVLAVKVMADQGNAIETILYVEGKENHDTAR